MNTVAHNEVQLTFPTGWEDGSHVIIKGPPHKEFVSSVVLVNEPLGNQTLEALAKKHLEALKSFPAYHLVKMEPAKVGPYSGIMREHTFAHGGTTVAQMQFLFIHGTRVFTLTFSDHNERFPQSRAVGLEIFGSLQMRADSQNAFEKKQKLMELKPQAELPAAPKDAPKETVPVPRGPVRG